MHEGGKYVVSAFIALVMIAFCFIDGKKNNAGPDFFWRGGKNDLMRNLLMRQDGSLRRYVKPVALLFFGTALVLLWTVPLIVGAK